jgi:hypothetical protein
LQSFVDVGHLNVEGHEIVPVVARPDPAVDAGLARAGADAFSRDVAVAVEVAAVDRPTESVCVELLQPERRPR